MQGFEGLSHFEGGFHEGVFDDLQAAGVEEVHEIAVFVGGGGGVGEEAVVEAHRGGNGMGGGHPVEGAFGFDAGGVLTALAVGVVGAVHFEDFAGLVVLDEVFAMDDVSPLEADVTARTQAEEFFRGVFHEVGALDVELAAEGHHSGAGAFVFGVVFQFEFFGLPFGVVSDDDFQGVEHGHDAAGGAVELFADASFQQLDFDDVVAAGHAGFVAESADGGRRVAPAAQPREGGHAGVVPALYVPFFHQFEQAPLAGDHVGDVHAGELDLPAGENLEFLDEPIVEGPVVAKLQGAQGVGDALDAVALPVREIVHRVDAPRVARAVVPFVLDAVHDGVAHVHVGRRHVDFGAQHAASIGEFAFAHAFEKVKVFLHAAVAVGAFDARLAGRAFHAGDFFGGGVVHVGQSFFDELDGEFVELGEIVGGVVFAVFPVIAQPADVAFDGLDVVGFFGGGVGVVEAQVALAAVLFRQPEVDGDGLGVADVKVAVGFRGEAGVHPSAVLAAGDVLFDDFLDEIAGSFAFRAHAFDGDGP